LLTVLDEISTLKNSAVPEQVIIDAIQKTIENGLAQKETIDTMSYEGFTKMMAALEKLSIQIFKRPDSEVGLAFLANVKSDYDNFNQVVSAFVQSKKIKDEAIDAYVKKPLVEVIADVNSLISAANDKMTDKKKALPLITKDIFMASSVAARIAETIESSKANYEIYKKDKEELDSKADLITTGIMN
jgi:hypothetical protein